MGGLFLYGVLPHPAPLSLIPTQGGPVGCLANLPKGLVLPSKALFGRLRRSWGDYAG